MTTLNKFKFNTIREEQLKNPDATFLTDAYSDLIHHAKDQAEGIELDLTELSCGLKLCIGSALADNEVWRGFVLKYLGKQPSGESAIGAMSTFPYRDEKGLIHNRFVFSVDPEASILAVEPVVHGQTYWLSEEALYENKNNGGDDPLADSRDL